MTHPLANLRIRKSKTKKETVQCSVQDEITSIIRNSETTTEAKDKVKGRLLLDVVIRKGPPVLQLLTGKDKPLLVRRNALLVLDLCFHIIDGIRTLYFQCYCLPSQCLHKDLHATTQTKNKCRVDSF